MNSIEEFIFETPWWVYGGIAVWASGAMVAQAIGGFQAAWYELLLMALGIAFMSWVAYREWSESIELAKEKQNV